MTTYAIGDVRGHFQTLQQLLDKIRYDREHDTLWFTGNLVGSGPDSLEVLRFVKGLNGKAISVLGDQELDLLSVAEGIKPQPIDEFTELLSAPDWGELLKWLRRRPFFYKDPVFTLVHAGIPSEWSISQTRTFATEVESALSMGSHKTFLENIVGDDPTRWHAKLRGWKRIRFITNAFTRMQYCDEDGRLDFSADVSVQSAPEGLIPWFRLPDRGTANQNIIFGHWNAASDPGPGVPGIFPLDTGCGQGGMLSAMRVSTTPEIISVPST